MDVESASSSSTEPLQLNNRRALPPTDVSAASSNRTEWANLGGSVMDGDYITLRNTAWKGTTITHSWNPATLEPGGDTRISAIKTPNANKKNGPSPLKLSPVRMDNEYTFCIRRVEFNTTRKAWVLPSWDAWKDRRPLNVDDYFVLLCPNSADLVLGTKNPPNAYANNGDYACKLIPFPLVTVAEANENTLTGHLQRIASFGFWTSNRVDFLSQSRCVWRAHSIAPDSKRGLIYGSAPINIRNMWTAIKSAETSILNMVTGGAIPFIINKTFNGGRNLTQAAGSDGKTVKLALSNHDRDDKSGWIIDAWHGNRYPVQRVMLPLTAPPLAPDEDPSRPGRRPEPYPDIVVPDLVEQIKRPPPAVPGTTIDIDTGTLKPDSLESKTQSQNEKGWFQNFSLLNLIATVLFGKKWDDLTWLQQFALGGSIVAIVLFLLEFGISAFIR